MPQRMRKSEGWRLRRLHAHTTASLHPQIPDCSDSLSAATRIIGPRPNSPYRQTNARDPPCISSVHCVGILSGCGHASISSHMCSSTCVESSRGEELKQPFKATELCVKWDEDKNVQWIIAKLTQRLQRPSLSSAPRASSSQFIPLQLNVVHFCTTLR